MFKRNLLAAVVLSVTAMSAFAGKAETLKPYVGPLPAPLQFASTQGGLEVYKKFQAAGGLDGWVVQDKSSAKNIIVYTTKDGEALIAGMMLDKNGKNLSGAYSEAYIPEPDYSEALAAFKSAAAVVEGKAKAKAEMVIVYDANCGFCKMMHKLVAPAIAAGELRVRYVPVAILGADSDVKGAGLLAAKNSTAAMDASVDGHGETSNDPALLNKVRANTELMKKYNFSGTPVVMYTAKVKGEDTVYVSPGVPAILEVFERLGINGQVEKLKADPSLQRFVR